MHTAERQDGFISASSRPTGGRNRNADIADLAVQLNAAREVHRYNVMGLSQAMREASKSIIIGTSPAAEPAVAGRSRAL